MDPTPGDDIAFLELADLFVDIAREIRLRSASTTPVVPLTQTQGQVMRYVHTHPGCSPSAIADGSGLQRANVSAALRELRGRGYITSQRDDTDGRAMRVHATALSDENIARLRRSWADVLEQAWARAAEADDTATLTTVIGALSRLRLGLAAVRAGEPAAPAASVSPPS